MQVHDLQEICTMSFSALLNNISRVAINKRHAYGGADKSLARPTSPCILFDGENISFDASLVLYI